MSHIKHDSIAELLIQVFGEGEKSIVVKAPGRVNLIGEHTDYNSGFVFPMAIDFYITVAARKRNDRVVRLFSKDYRSKVEFSLDNPITYDPENKWSNYPRGVLAVLQEEGIKICGMDMAFAGDIPQGAGLSSSAALEVATAVAVQNLVGFKMSKLKLAELCQRAENEFVGMKCGIMDQMISMIGEKNHALFLDCRTLEYKQIPLHLGEYRILICQSGVKHSLVDSAYNKRREQCEEGVKVLARRFPQI